MNELRQVIRSLRRSPAFTGVATLTLAVGIGASVAIFTVLNAVVLEPLDYPDSGRLVSITHPVPGLNPEWEWPLSSGGYFHFREHSQALDGLGVIAGSSSSMTLVSDGPARRVATVLVSASLFDVLGARPLHGRLLLEADNEAVAELDGFGVAVLGHDFWRMQYGADPTIVGRTIQLGGQTVEVVGVIAPGFDLPRRSVDIWLPLNLRPSMFHANSHFMEGIGRLAPDVTLEAATADLLRLTGQLPEAVPTAYGDSFVDEARFATAVRPLKEAVVGDFSRLLWVLFGAIAVVLLIACANVANLFLVRLDGRGRERAVREALGAGRGALLRPHLIEGLAVGAMAGAAGLLVAAGGLSFLLAAAPEGIPRLDEVALGWKSVLFTVTLALGSGTIFGLLPAFRRGTRTVAIAEGNAGTGTSRRRQRVRGGLVVAQVALALVLVASSGLLLQTFRNLNAVEPGLETDGRLTFQLSIAASDYPGYRETARFYQAFLDEVEALPGVVRAGAISTLPFSGGYQGGCSLVFPEFWDAANQPYPCVSTAYASPGLFEALGIPYQGEVSSWAVNDAGRAGALVSRSFAENVWPDGALADRGITGNFPEQPHFPVIGVVEDIRAAGLDRPAVELVYFPLVPVEGAQLWAPPRGMTVVVHTALADPASLTGAIRSILAELDPNVPLGSVRTMDDIVRTSMARTSFATLLLLCAGAIALFLGMIGLYGTLAYVVERRTRELGVRMALGAQAAQIQALVVRYALRLVLPGLALGLIAFLLTSHFLQHLLFEVAPRDPVALLVAGALLLVTALVAAWLPARRASRVDPMIALRAE